MKNCPVCNNQLKDSASFCDNCGARVNNQTAQQFHNNSASQDFDETYALYRHSNQSYEESQSQPMYNEHHEQNVKYMYNGQQQENNQSDYSGQQFYYDNQQNCQSQVNQKVLQKNGFKWWHIPFALVGLLLAFAILMSIIEKSKMNASLNSGNNTPTYNNSVGNNTDSNADSSNDDKTLAFSKGSITDGEYINEWADIRYKIPEKWEEFENSNPTSIGVEVGCFVGDKESGENIIFAFERLFGANVDIDEESYLDIAKNNVKEEYSSMDLTTKFSKEKEYSIAGETFFGLDITAEGVSNLMQRFLVLKKDNYMIVITITATDKTSADKIVKRIEALS